MYDEHRSPHAGSRSSLATAYECENPLWCVPERV